ncbi:MAG: DUF2085 domain-containing protein [Chloroflexi bacterium]|nr:DUF2085 domain-containing protein [Chloroflexota bacterium]
MTEQSTRRSVVVWLNKAVLWFARRWALVVGLVIGIYAAGPWVAPLAQRAGATGIADALYTVYSPVCHQFTFRSWFIGGEQAAYPRERANSPLGSFESYADDEAFFLENVDDLSVLDGDLTIAARLFRGSETMGYKTAICQRDIAIYTALGLTAIGFAVANRAGLKVPYLPFWAYILIALGPIGLDGFSQLFANPPFNGFGLPFYPIRESTPFLRTLTGALFGLGNGWLAFPYIEDSMRETQELVEQKLFKAGILSEEQLRVITPQDIA